MTDTIIQGFALFVTVAGVWWRLAKNEGESSQKIINLEKGMSEKFLSIEKRHDEQVKLLREQISALREMVVENKANIANTNKVVHDHIIHISAQLGEIKVAAASQAGYLRTMADFIKTKGGI